MNYQYLALSFFLILFIVYNQSTNNGIPNKVPLIKATLDFSKINDQGSSDEADKFMRALEANTGKVIELKLEIIPTQDKDSLGYSLVTDQTPLNHDSDESKIKCGNGMYGIIENYSYNVKASFNHTSNYHNPTSIHLGNRAKFPKISVRCGSHTDKTYTHLYISGHFVVDSTEIPTAIEKVLFPYNY